MPDNVGHMFYYGETPWHGKGKKLSGPADAEQALREAGLDWEVALIPLRTAEEPPSSVLRRMAVVRQDCKRGDPGRVIGVVHPGFRPLQNRDGVMMFDALIGRGQRVYHTGGYLGNGEVIWLLARLPAEIRVRHNDYVEPYMLFTNSHDGSIAIDFRLTTVRVVCQNTLSLALANRKSKAVFKRAHQGDYKRVQAEAEEFFQLWHDATSAVGEQFRAMSKIPCGLDTFQKFVERLLPMPRPPVHSQPGSAARRQHETRLRKVLETRESIVKVFDLGIQNEVVVPPAEETLWGALNAVTAFVDHEQPIDGDRYAYIHFGNGAALKRSAYSLALSYLPDSWKQGQLFS